MLGDSGDFQTSRYQGIVKATASGVFEDLKFKIVGCLSLAETANRADSRQLQFWSEPSEILNLRSSNTPETGLVSISWYRKYDIPQRRYLLGTRKIQTNFHTFQVIDFLVKSCLLIMRYARTLVKSMFMTKLMTLQLCSTMQYMGPSTCGVNMPFI